MKRFLKNLLKHPGTWMLGAFIALVIGIFMPLAAPALMSAAAVGLGIGVLALIPYLMNFILPFSGHHQTFGLYSGFLGKNGNFFKDHSVQAVVLTLTVLAFITALVLTIGFFTGGAGFAFMGPIFAALSSPFAIATASAHVSLFLPALAGFCFVMAPLVVGNNLKRFLGWIDSFRYDAFVDYSIDVKEESCYKLRQLHEVKESYPDKEKVRKVIDSEIKRLKGIQSNQTKSIPLIMMYPFFIGEGVINTLANDFSSPHEDKMDEARLKRPKNN